MAIIGRPNAGKSTLLNALVGEERAIVSPIAGTTRDAVDETVSHAGTDYVFIDTAGIRRKGKTKLMAEKLSACPAGTSSSGGSSTSSRLVSSSSRSASGRIWPGVSPLRTAEEKKRNSAGRPGDQPELAALDQLLGALLHALRHDAQRLDRRPEPGNGRHRRLQADIVRARRAGLDAHALAGGAVAPVDRGALGDREIRLEALQLPDRLRRRSRTPADRARGARIGAALNTPPLNSTAVGISAAPPARAPTSAASFSLACTFCRLRVRKRARCLLITGSDA